MHELERRLADYGEELDLPEADLAATVVVRLASPRPTGHRVRLAVIAAVVGAAIVGVAVSPAGGTLWRVLRLEGASIVRIDRLPALPSGPVAALGAETTLEDAARRAPFEVLVPGPAPDSVYFAVDRAATGEVASVQVSLVYGALERPRLVLTRYVVTGRHDLLEKEVPDGVPVERVAVRDAAGVWIDGPHLLGLGASRRIAGSTLLWEDAGVVTRIEADLSRDEVLALAESLARYDAEAVEP